MQERFEKRQLYEFCEIRKTMVRLDVIQSTDTMPDMAQAEVKLVPTDCNRAKDCKREGIKCIVYDRNGSDPCPGLWKGLDI